MLQPGVVITLEPFEETDKKEEYRCKVVDVEDGKLFIDYPISVQTNRAVFLMEGMRLTVSFLDPAASSAVYLFRTEVIGRVKKKIPMLVLQDPGANQYVRIQRRKFVRIQKAVDTAIEFKGMPPFSSLTEDISAGGAAVVLPDSVEVGKGSEATVYGVLPSQQAEPLYFEARADLVRIQQDDKGRRIGSFEFKDLPHTEQQMLMRFCFEQQLRLRRKGLE
ncbi:flagellar brake protein [Domibacillus robiginosus]|uniref:flagellar brake protein n=1 Tax=Domibacillus robiginosus TaxID=1071054 RepID=UPI00067C3C0E|nr:flagellar brake domain-containing protein [Domibacillus robiginosus]